MPILAWAQNRAEGITRPSTVKTVPSRFRMVYHNHILELYEVVDGGVAFQDPHSLDMDRFRETLQCGCISRKAPCFDNSHCHRKQHKNAVV